MKRIFLLLPVFFFLNAPGQQPNNSIRVGPSNKNVSKDSLQKLIAKLNMRSYPQAKLLSSFADGTKLYALPQDNMPCLVPDLSQFKMPIAGKGFKIDGMPPGSGQPRSLIPKTE